MCCSYCTVNLVVKSMGVPEECMGMARLQVIRMDARRPFAFLWDVHLYYWGEPERVPH